MEYKDIVRRVRAKLEGRRREAGLRRGERWLLSIDHDSAHEAANLDAEGIWPKQQMLDLAALSPDMHMVIENVVGYLADQEHKWQRSLNGVKPTVQQCKDQLNAIFAGIKKETIESNVRRLRGTYQAIIDAGGMYPSHEYRQ